MPFTVQRSRRPIALVLIALVALLATAQALFAQVPTDPPTIASDKADYAPGELVTLTGTSWQPGESVTVDVNDDVGQSWRRTVTVVADVNGAFTDQFNLPDWFIAEYRVVATGPSSGTATTTFTDARVVVSVTLNGGTSVTVAPSASISATANVTTDGTGANARWRSTSWRISTTAPGTVTCVNHTDHDGAGSYTESFPLTAPGTAGIYNAYFRAHADDTCGGAGGGASNLFTLSNAVTVVAGPTKLVFTTSAHSGAVFACLGPITVQTQNASSVATNVTTNTTVNLATDAAGGFYSDVGCTTSITSQVINAGTNSTTFYYRATSVGAGTHGLTASATGLTSASQTQTINKAATTTT
ncbi:MAG: hypothetical protein ABIP53_08050, partial [Candidatus Limnocylindrales bacterium]